MTNFANFIQHFPSRCKTVLELMNSDQRFEEYDVTVLLMAAATGLIVPHERLKPDTTGENDLKKITKDQKIFKEAAESYQKLCEEHFQSSSSLWRDEDPGEWYSGNVKGYYHDLDSWPRGKIDQPMSYNKTVGRVIKIIRNGLAHGNIYTTGREISLIVFVAWDYNAKGLDFVASNPETFKRFLNSWFDCLSRFKLPDHIYFEHVA